MIVVRLQTVVAHGVPPTEDRSSSRSAASRAGNKSDVIPDSAQLQLNLRTYSDTIRSTMLDAIADRDSRVPRCRITPGS